jgi:hypothetical protein
MQREHAQIRPNPTKQDQTSKKNSIACGYKLTVDSNLNLACIERSSQKKNYKKQSAKPIGQI